MADCEKCALKCTDEIKIAKHHKGRMPMGNCIDFTPKQTNADRIRAMNDEELAWFICIHEVCNWNRAKDKYDIPEIIKWLQSEAE